MNVEMWNHPAVQRNIAQLIADGVHIAEPESGWLSCRVQGKGRMAEADTLFDQLQEVLTQVGSTPDRGES